MRFLMNIAILNLFRLVVFFQVCEFMTSWSLPLVMNNKVLFDFEFPISFCDLVHPCSECA